MLGFFNCYTMKITDQKLLDDLIDVAQSSERRRKNHNFHKEASDTLQRMLNALEPDSYVQPHKHEDPDKREVFLVLSGRFLVVEFNDEGDIVEFIILDASNGSFAAEIAPKVWHTIMSLDSGSVAYEVKDGPYLPINDKNFASWAPKEGDAGTKEYMTNLKKKVGLL